MTTSQTPGLVSDVAGLAQAVGTHLGFTDWQEMTQDVSTSSLTPPTIISTSTSTRSERS